MVGDPTPEDSQPTTAPAVSAPAARADRLTQSADLVHSALSDRMRDLGLSAVTDCAIRLEQACEESAQQGNDTGYARAKSEIDKLSMDDIEKLLLLYIASFHTLNTAEQVEIAQRNHDKEIGAAEHSAPRRDSIRFAVDLLRGEPGRSPAAILKSFEAIAFADTGTAHPTQAKGPDTLHHLDAIKAQLRTLQSGEITPTERGELLERFGQSVGLLLCTPPHRQNRKEVMEEVREGLALLSKAPYQEIPRLYREFREAMRDTGQEFGELPVIYRFRSWIGGDRDGHSGVSPKITRDALELHRSTIIGLYCGELENLSRDLSISSEVVRTPRELRESISDDRAALSRVGQVPSPQSSTPFREKADLITLKLLNADGIGYRSGDFVADLATLEKALESAGLPQNRELEDLKVRARTFGFHFAALDIRQHSDQHERALSFMIREERGLDYASMTEAERQTLLTGLILEEADPVNEPYRSSDAELNSRVFDVFAEIKRAKEHDPASIGSYIVSMTHEASDLLEVVYLMKRAGLFSMTENGPTSEVDIVPLFETIQDLRGCGDFVRKVFQNPAYAAHLAARGEFQEAQFGPSDSNKDGGYICATWELWKAQESFAQACVDSGKQFGIFVGRGGPHARGGGRLHQSILAAPAITAQGEFRVTLQGEVLAERHGDPDLFHRHMEQVVSALIRQKASAGDQTELSAPERAVMNKLAEESRQAYRGLVEDNKFWDWFSTYTPFPEMQFLRYASRPIVREGSALNFDNARAIPWNMAWTQLRYNVPGWFGMGSAVASLSDEEKGTLRGMMQDKPNSPWSIMLSSVERELARARLPIARWYGPGEELHEQFHAAISAEFNRTCQAVSEFTGRSRMVVNSSWLQNHIEERRNPATDVVNLICARLKGEIRDETTDAATRDRIERQLMPLGMNAIAAAMQTTG